MVRMSERDAINIDPIELSRSLHSSILPLCDEIENACMHRLSTISKYEVLRKKDTLTTPVYSLQSLYINHTYTSL